MVLRKGDAVRYALDRPLSFAAKGGDAHAIIVLVITSTGSSGGPKSSVRAGESVRPKRARLR